MPEPTTSGDIFYPCGCVYNVIQGWQKVVCGGHAPSRTGEELIQETMAGLDRLATEEMKTGERLSVAAQGAATLRRYWNLLKG